MGKFESLRLELHKIAMCATTVKLKRIIDYFLKISYTV